MVIPICALKIWGATAQIKYSAGLIISTCICFGFYVCSITSIKKTLQNKREMIEQWVFMIKFEGPLVLHSLSYMILNQSDRVMIGKFVGNAQAAYYSVAYNLSTVIILFQNSANQALLPWRYQMLQEKNYKKMKQMNTYLLGLFAGGILLFILICPEIMKILFTANYYEAIWCIPPISLSVFFMFLYTIFVNIETYFEKTQYVMYVSVLCGLLNIVLNYFGILYVGYIACAYATLVSYILFSVGHYYFMKQILKTNQIKTNEIIDTKKVVLISSFAIIVTVLITSMYNFAVLRWIISGVVFCLLVLKRKNISQILILFKNKE